jgi:hypothetical protein
MHLRRHHRGRSTGPTPVPTAQAAILSSVDDAIEKTQAMMDQVEVVKKGLMGELFSRGPFGRHKRSKGTS